MMDCSSLGLQRCRSSQNEHRGSLLPWGLAPVIMRVLDWSHGKWLMRGHSVTTSSLSCNFWSLEVVKQWERIRKAASVWAQCPLSSGNGGPRETPQQANNFVSLQISVLYIFIRYLVERLSFVWVKIKKRREKMMLEFPQRPWAAAWAVQRPSGLQLCPCRVSSPLKWLFQIFFLLTYNNCSPWKSHFPILLFF